MTQSKTVSVHLGDSLGRYGFGGDHPLSQNRMDAFWDEMQRRHLDFQVRVLDPVAAAEEQLLRFHAKEYVDKVKTLSETGNGMLDYGDTPAYKGVFEAAACVVGSTVDAVHRIMAGEVRRAFVPIAGLHHGMPDSAAGFCVFNDCGVAIKILLEEYGLERVAYVDIDAHHGDGVYYPFEEDPRVIVADIHEDGRYVFPQTGFQYEVGKGEARGTKLNIPLLPRADDHDFSSSWDQVETFLDRWKPQFILMQCGADGLLGDPLAHLAFTAGAHRRAAAALCRMAERYSDGRILGLGGGGYDLRNLGKAWVAVVEAFLETPMSFEQNSS